MIGDTATRVLLAVVNQRRPTVRSVAREVGKSPTVVLYHLRNLRTEGLVTWENGRAGTLRKNVRSIDRTPVRKYNQGQHTSGPRTALTAGVLAEPYEGGSDMPHRTSPVSRSQEGRR